MNINAYTLTFLFITLSTAADESCKRSEIIPFMRKKSSGQSKLVTVYCDERKVPYLTSDFIYETVIGPPTPIKVPTENTEGILHDDPVKQTPTYQLTLQEAELQTIQDGAFHAVPTLELLNLRTNKLKEIRRRTFEGLLGLKDLNLGQNDIAKVEAFSFSQQQELLYLTISENKLKELNYFTFRGLLKSRYLNLELNNISVLRSGAFAAMPSLENLRLSFNKINKLDGGILAGLRSLKHLYLASNDIEEILDGAFRGSSKLESLDLSRNLLTTIGTATFDGLMYLRRLYLGSNRIVHIDDGSFQRMPLLRELDLSKNSIKTLSRGMFMGLVNLNYFYMSFNRLGQTAALSEDSDAYQRLIEALSILCRKRGLHFSDLRRNGLLNYMQDVDGKYFGYDISDSNQHRCLF